jgi:hypothetical protein
MPPNDSANIYNLSNSFENIIKDVYFIYKRVYIFINCQKYNIYIFKKVDKKTFISFVIR